MIKAKTEWAALLRIESKPQIQRWSIYMKVTKSAKFNFHMLKDEFTGERKFHRMELLS